MYTLILQSVNHYNYKEITCFFSEIENLILS